MHTCSGWSDIISFMWYQSQLITLIDLKIESVVSLCLNGGYGTLNLL